jgi:VTC domain
LRYEYKYYVPAYRLAELRGMLMPFVHPDKFAAKHEGNQYTVRSIYFDTAGFDMYHSKRDHLAHRMKVRLRSYNTEAETNSVFFEIKRKYEAPIVKNRAALPFSAVKAIFKGEPLGEFLPETDKADNIRRFLYQYHRRRLNPVVNVIYEREVYISNLSDKENDLRITLDKNLRCVPYPAISELYKERNLQFPLHNEFILEVKFNHYCPAWLRPMLAQLELRKEPASKYVISIDAQPEIRTDKKYSIIYQSNRAARFSEY